MVGEMEWGKGAYFVSDVKRTGLFAFDGVGVRSGGIWVGCHCDGLSKRWAVGLLNGCVEKLMWNEVRWQNENDAQRK